MVIRISKPGRVRREGRKANERKEVQRTSSTEKGKEKVSVKLASSTRPAAGGEGGGRRKRGPTRHRRHVFGRTAAAERDFWGAGAGPGWQGCACEETHGRWEFPGLPQVDESGAGGCQSHWRTGEEAGDDGSARVPVQHEVESPRPGSHIVPPPL